ncbi:ricin-type beta-trefoil lectin domain protein [Streptomyces humicola]|uniref:ricin-type beta-trefoil lectin domain protein n=1 Tax=Streptomyces humicola TaxID=2953240 RepID=UPI0027E2647F|nr:ricin-type beta-trefoil lectin domain protein [Streptomyces humicola]
MAAAAALPVAMMALTLGSTATAHAATGFPAHYAAPYLQIAGSDAGDMSADMNATGLKDYTLAFLIPQSGCTAQWEDDGSAVGAFASQINSLTAAGGNVIISFGGASGGELAQTCTSVSALTAAYANVVNTYGVTRLDFDIEGSVLGDTAANTRRDQALAALQAENPSVQVDYTLAVAPDGLPSQEMGVLQDAKSQGVNVSLVNIMTMDFGDGQNPLSDAESAAQATAGQLASLYGISTSAAYARMGLTPIAGQNDDNEFFSQSDASALESFAASNGVQELSFWEVDGYDKPVNYAYSRIFNQITGSSSGGGSATGPITGYGGLCVDDSGASTANFNPIQVYTCNGTGAQQWTVAAGNTLQVLGKCMDINGGGTTNGTTVDLYDCNGTGAQVWQPQSNGALLNPQSGKCLDDTNWSTTPGTQLQIWDCTGNANQKWTLPTVSGGGSGSAPNLGPNVLTFDPSMPSATIQNEINNVYSQQQSNQFGTSRYALLFAPGTYNVNLPVGFYTQVLGLGLSPNDTTITGGGVNADASWNGGNATENFWRSAENLTMAPSSGTTKWAVSQAAPLRRVHVQGNLVLDDNGGWSSGGFLGDSEVDGQVNSGSQQQWLSRNDQLGSWTGSNWNMVFVGDTGAPAQSFPNPPYTTIGQTPVSAEQPFLYIDGSGNYNVFVPADRTNSTGTDWSGGPPAGTSLPIGDFYIATPSDTADTINAALAAGKDLLFTPGVYQLDGTINVTNPDTVVLGLGLATLVANNGTTAISVADVNGVKIAGLIVDAGTTNSPVLMQVGPAGSTSDHADDPTVLSDVYFRIGGATPGQATQTLQVNSNNVIGDNMWLWRADHGNGVGWTSNTAANGLIVNGTDVTMYGLAVEHYQQYQVTWNGNGGRTYFYQSEMPYDPPDQSSWMNGSSNGYASYKVADTVTSHQAYGLGVYCYFSTNPSVVADRAIEVPDTSGVQLSDMVTVSLGGTGTISHIVNSTGGPSNSNTSVADLISYP